MINIIKDDKGNILKEPEQKYIIERANGTMVEADDYREAAAVICGYEYLDCECAETEWHMRVDAAKKIGLAILAEEDDARVIVYDERIGKIPYSYTDSNPDYDIPRNPELIRVENDEALLLTLAQINHLRIWIKTDDDYKNILSVEDVDSRVIEIAVSFADKKTPIPLHQRIE